MTFEGGAGGGRGGEGGRAPPAAVVAAHGVGVALVPPLLSVYGVSMSEDDQVCVYVCVRVLFRLLSSLVDNVPLSVFFFFPIPV